MRTNQLIRVASAILIFGIILAARPAASAMKGPKEVVEQFWRMETHGGRLTAKGWMAADHYFLRPSQWPRKMEIGVVDNEYSIEKPFMRDSNTAIVTVNIGGRTWKIDPKMRIRVFLDQVKGFMSYDLVLTSKHFEFTPDHRALREVTGSPEWRIKDEGDVWLTKDTAIQYLAQMRDKTTDPVIKRNAEQSIATLKRAQGSR